MIKICGHSELLLLPALLFNTVSMSFVTPSKQAVFGLFYSDRRRFTGLAITAIIYFLILR
jgi:hypothetical protein